MTPEERNRLDKLEKLVNSLLNVENVPFIGNLERRVATGIVDESTTTTVTSILKAVNESGSSTYNVAKVPDRKVGVTFTDGTSGFIGVYNS